MFEDTNDFITISSGVKRAYILSSTSRGQSSTLMVVVWLMARALERELINFFVKVRVDDVDFPSSGAVMFSPSFFVPCKIRKDYEMSGCSNGGLLIGRGRDLRRTDLQNSSQMML
ncbi:hypothetical protein L1887_23860 [Cichorium endivia]|nr:hypothetical protein L1887_23860 [Cichorium endivia]